MTRSDKHFLLPQNWGRGGLLLPQNWGLGSLLCLWLALPGGAWAQVPLAPPAVSASDGRPVVQHMLDAENSLALMGTQTTTLTGRHETSVQRVWRNGGHAVRTEFLQPPRLAGDIVVDNGRVFWHYAPQSRTLEVGPSRLERMRRRVPQVEHQIERGTLLVQKQGQETVAGRVCDIVDVLPKAGGPRRRFWVDTASGAQMAVEQYGRDGRLRSASRFTDLTLNPAFASDTFQPPRVPKDVRTVPEEDGQSLPTVAAAQAKVSFPLLQPAFLPDGYKFQSASVSEFRGRQIASLRYGDGLNVLSLFQTLLPPNAPPPSGKISHPRPGVLTAVQGRTRLILVGSGAAGDLERVLASLH